MKDINTKVLKTDMRDMSIEEIGSLMASIGEPDHRAVQVFRWINNKGIARFEEMTDIPKALIAYLKDNFQLGSLYQEECLVSKDGTRKFLWSLSDGNLVESVLIRDGKRRTLCLSTQVGCRFKCPFCASGERGFKRDLSVAEITGQIICSSKLTGEKATNIVFMGMGEPLDNFDNLIRAIRTINHPEGIGIGARKITISTCGIVPAIRKLKNAGIQIELSVSLHAAEDALRNELVPVNRKYPLNELVSVCREYNQATHRIITLEYTLMKGCNDSLRDADKLAGIARNMKAKVNLIGCNAFASSGYLTPSVSKIADFRKRLILKGVTATIRRSRGDDIMGACGQLAAKKEPETRFCGPGIDI